MERELSERRMARQDWRTIREMKLLRRSKKAYSLVSEKVRRNVGVVWMTDYMK